MAQVRLVTGWGKRSKEPGVSEVRKNVAALLQVRLLTLHSDPLQTPFGIQNISLEIGGGARW
eukprot:7498832-Pyramimonas_sp.AAC.1